MRGVWPVHLIVRCVADQLVQSVYKDMDILITIVWPVRLQVVLNVL